MTTDDGTVLLRNRPVISHGWPLRGLAGFQRVTLALACATLFVTGCQVGAPVAPQTTPAPADFSGTGTWEKNLAYTTCGDFQTKMTGNEQFAVAGNMLDFNRSTTVLSAPAPPTDMVQKFQQAIATICGQQGGEYPIIGAGVLAYSGDKSYEPPYR